MNSKECAELYKELEMYENNGIHMILNNAEMSALQIVKAHTMREAGVYMRDYVMNKEGHVKALRFDKIM